MGRNSLLKHEFVRDFKDNSNSSSTTPMHFSMLEWQARFQLLPTDTKAADFTFEPSEGAVPTGQTQIIHVKAYTKLRGAFESKFVWNVEGSQYNPALFFRGCIGNPSICINALFIEFGLIAYGFSAQRSFKVRNCSMATLNFKIYIVQCDCRPAFAVEPECTSIKAQVHHINH